MKVGGVALLLMMSCGASPSAKAPTNMVSAAPRKELYCRDGKPKPSGLASKDPSQGGYRRLPDETALLTVRGAIATASIPTTDLGRQAAAALISAIHDLQEEIRACMAQADRITPNLQYMLNVRFMGSSAATIVDAVSLKRIAGHESNGMAREAATTAEACVGALLQLLELPPSDSRFSAMGMVLRYDFCTPAYDVGRTIAQTYARAFPDWAAAHPGGGCPSRLDDLHPYMRMKETVDPWGHRFQLRCSDGALQVWSAGRDGKLDTDDDVTSWR